MRISDWSSDVCSSDLRDRLLFGRSVRWCAGGDAVAVDAGRTRNAEHTQPVSDPAYRHQPGRGRRSEEHTSELQSLMRISYAVFCLKKKNKKKKHDTRCKKSHIKQHNLKQNRHKKKKNT